MTKYLNYSAEKKTDGIGARKVFEHGGKGFSVEATSALIEALVEKIDIKVFCHPENKAAHAVAKKYGLKPEGNIQ